MSPPFGSHLKRWFARNEWPQSVPELWAKSTGCEIGPWGSQISIAMSGRLSPKPDFFKALGRFNAAVASKTFKGVTDRRLLDRLNSGDPMVYEDGRAFTALDFFALYIDEGGAQPYFAEQARELTQEDCELWAAELRLLFDKVCRQHMCSRAEGWKMVGPGIRQACLDDADWIQDLLAGLVEPDLDVCGRMLEKYRGQTPIVDVLESFLEDGEAGKVRGLRAELDGVRVAPHLFKAPLAR